MKEFLNKNDYWISGVNAVFLAIFSAFLTFDLDSISSKTNPIKHWIVSIVVDISPFGLALFLVTTLVIAMFKKWSEETIESVKKENAKLSDRMTVISENVPQLFDGVCSNIASKMNLGSKERITLYVHDKNGSFSPVSRYSKNPVKKSKGRSKYKDSEGVLAQAWQHGRVFDNHADLQNKTKWANYCHSKYSLDKVIARKISFKAHLYAGIAIYDSKKSPIGILLLESENSNFISEDDAVMQMETHALHLSELIQNLFDLIPMSSIASERGF
ncbi:hypothetical protein [Vogesella indigofera]|uniref:hypothetical protein n=1 Tax=Vogesella indigofera TaxID=45465 RepID=UPI0035B2E27B